MKEMTNHEAIEGLNGLIKWEHKGNSPSKYKIKMFRMSIEALEKQIPKKPLHHWTGNETEILCPCCKEYPFDTSEYEWARKYCGKCGQAIDWSNE